LVTIERKDLVIAINGWKNRVLPVTRICSGRFHSVFLSN
jgi:hypothetical protein